MGNVFFYMVWFSTGAYRGSFERIYCFPNIYPHLVFGKNKYE